MTACCCLIATSELHKLPRTTRAHSASSRPAAVIAVALTASATEDDHHTRRSTRTDRHRRRTMAATTANLTSHIAQLRLRVVVARLAVTAPMIQAPQNVTQQTAIISPAILIGSTDNQRRPVRL